MLAYSGPERRSRIGSTHRKKAGEGLLSLWMLEGAMRAANRAGWPPETRTSLEREAEKIRRELSQLGVPVARIREATEL
jgi:hypothetical protein